MILSTLYLNVQLYSLDVYLHSKEKVNQTNKKLLVNRKVTCLFYFKMLRLKQVMKRRDIQLVGWHLLCLRMGTSLSFGVCAFTDAYELSALISSRNGSSAIVGQVTR